MTDDLRARLVAVVAELRAASRIYLANNGWGDHMGPVYMQRVSDELDRLDAILASAPAEPSGWQPIETAPKGSGEDGPQDTRHPDYVEPPNLWLALEDELHCVGYWDWYYAEGGSGYDGGSAWVEAFGGTRVTPTHWMPLPPPPEAP